MTRSCPWCGAAFQPRTKTQRFCSTAHKNAWHKRARELGEAVAAGMPPGTLRETRILRTAAPLAETPR